MVQPYVEQAHFEIVLPPPTGDEAARNGDFDDPSAAPPATETWKIVATILCIDATFYGPGIFRAAPNDLVALVCAENWFFFCFEWEEGLGAVPRSRK